MQKLWKTLQSWYLHVYFWNIHSLLVDRYIFYFFLFFAYFLCMDNPNGCMCKKARCKIMCAKYLLYGLFAHLCIFSSVFMQNPPFEFISCIACWFLRNYYLHSAQAICSTRHAWGHVLTFQVRITCLIVTYWSCSF